MKMKKNVKIAIVITLAILVIFFASFGLYAFGLGSRDKSQDTVSFIVREQTRTMDILQSLKDEGLIRSKTAAYVYSKLHGYNSLKAGRYTFEKNLGAKEILRRMQEGETDSDIRITFIEGKRLADYVEQLAEAFSWEKNEVITKLADTSYLQTLIDTYWFLDESILNKDLYYPLEGYLFADTYFFTYDATLEDVVAKMLDNTGEKLETLRKEITSGKYSVHEILSIAATIELEATDKEEDKKMIGELIYNRLNANMSLGMDATSYYGMRLQMGEVELTEETGLYDENPFNTRALSGMEGKLPAGPICSPSFASIDAAVHPAVGDYYYVYAKDGVLYFTKTESEHDKIIQELNQ